MAHSLFITFEGGEAAGKSTQVNLLEKSLSNMGHKVIKTREPGGAPGAEALRNFLLFGPQDLSLRAEIMAHFSARCDHIDKTIQPALKEGKIVLCDRYYDSTSAYQGYGRAQGDPEILAFIEALKVQVRLMPNLTFYLHVPRTVAVARIKRRAHLTDRYESYDESYHQRVEEAFQSMALQEPKRFRTIDATGSIENIHSEILSEVSNLLHSGNSV
ncbi:dTMP kinase [Entomobacter blattae]|uniref:Thymidylate kinase n=1 Tax=Entomobacter blattae TaxID=2762277 RepID=A0A7H1NT16_9PROT|nr:dTMP kinase [Entomobacter blattae]QNT78926.1 Thymidylate kinase [Entomobacter blattae]